MKKTLWPMETVYRKYFDSSSSLALSSTFFIARAHGSILQHKIDRLMKIMFLKMIYCEPLSIFACALTGRKQTDKLLQYVMKQIALKRNGVCLCV